MNSRRQRPVAASSVSLRSASGTEGDVVHVLSTGTLLLAPLIPNGVAGTALTVFSGGLVAMYARTPAMHKPGSIWPSRIGIGVSKDVWMLGIGLGLLAAGSHRRGVLTRSP
jgi:hypothetical protein